MMSRHTGTRARGSFCVDDTNRSIITIYDKGGHIVHGTFKGSRVKCTNKGLLVYFVCRYSGKRWLEIPSFIHLVFASSTIVLREKLETRTWTYVPLGLES